MKIKIAKRMVPPLLYGVLAGWIITGAAVAGVLIAFAGTAVTVAAVSVSAVLLLTLFPALRRSAVVYSKALKYHRAEYLYNLGNGVEATLAVGAYEKKSRRAATAWLKRKLWKSSFGALPVSYFMMVMAGVGWIPALELTILLAVTVFVAVVIGIFTMLFSARRCCYDKFGNIRSA